MLDLIHTDTYESVYIGLLIAEYLVGRKEGVERLVLLLCMRVCMDTHTHTHTHTHTLRAGGSETACAAPVASTLSCAQG
jgi:hypothetical protein